VEAVNGPLYKLPHCKLQDINRYCGTLYVLANGHFGIADRSSF
jgi:hypothetical protein